MELYTTYSVKIKHYNHIFNETVYIYRNAVDFFIDVCVSEWNNIDSISGDLSRQRYVENICISTKQNPNIRYNFHGMDKRFYKFPCYLRRAAITEALGKVSSYMSNLKQWELNPSGQKPGIPSAGMVYPCLYRGNMYEQTGTYTTRIKVFIRNTWDWIAVNLRKSDMDYIARHCGTRKHCAPTLQKRGKQWFLDFPFVEDVKLADADVHNRTILAVDLGINSAATVSVIHSDGTILGRHFLKLSKEQDSLNHTINRIKKAQQHGAYHTPRLWNRTKGINQDIAVKTAHFIMNVAVLYNADVIVFEHLDLNGRKRGSKKQKLHLWKSRTVQSMVGNKAHRLGMRISRVNAWGTSKLAYDGSGVVERGIDGNYSICRFANGKTYNCDLSATYNIGARYFIREILKSLPETARLQLEAKVPQVCKRSTCTFSTLINLHAVLAA